MHSDVQMRMTPNSPADEIREGEGFGVPVYTKENLEALCSSPLPETGALLLVDKPSGWTSFDVVARTRRLLNVKKVGHTGTLDPMATGVLVICLGRATRLADRIQAGVKEYIGTIRFGAETTTDDAEGEITLTFPVEHLTAAEIESAAAGFVGTSMQTPPQFSARKVGGKRMYEIARKGGSVEAPPREITIFELELLSVQLPDVEVRIVCSKGTYIRSVARDLGRLVGSGAHLAALRRTRSGEFTAENGVTMERLAELCTRDTGAGTA